MTLIYSFFDLLLDLLLILIFLSTLYLFTLLYLLFFPNTFISLYLFTFPLFSSFQ